MTSIHEKQKAKPFSSIENIVSAYFELSPPPFRLPQYEFEIKFGTKGIRPLTKNDYTKLIKKLKSRGFECADENGEYSLKIQHEFLDSNSGSFRMSDIRTEIYGIEHISNYCKTNDLEPLKSLDSSLILRQKRSMFSKDRSTIYNFYNNDFNFTMSLQSEQNVSSGTKDNIISNWKQSKKTFRYLNRVTFVHDDYPVKIDISMVKSGIKEGAFAKPVYTVGESNVFKNPSNIEVEIEIDNYRVGPGTPFTSPALLLDAIRKAIKLVLSGLQETNYPISYPQQKKNLEAYMKLIWEDKFDQAKIMNSHFIGPSSVTLQMTNVAPLDENSTIINIRNDFVVTDKADGERHLLFINGSGEIYLINTNMTVIFTGAVTREKEYFDSILDGELIATNKMGKFINLYAAFDIYYVKKEDVRALPFFQRKKEPKSDDRSRYKLLQKITTGLNAVEVGSKNLSPIMIKAKEFYLVSSEDRMFSGCDSILGKAKDNGFDYHTDGLIISPAYNGVGSDKQGHAGPKTRITWEYSFKWKPPEQNTIDFLVTTTKDTNGVDIVKTIYEDGLNMESGAQLTEYKTIQLRCGFDENDERHGFLNPCQDILDDKLPQFSDQKVKRGYKPMQFYPTDPFDSEAGITNIGLKKDASGLNQMFTAEEDADVFNDLTIVEFRYDLAAKPGWRWIPLHVRYDKTTEMLQGKQNFGNAFHVANDNWKSIHNPISEDMIRTGANIPSIMSNEDVYYNNSTGKFKTDNMKNFHNLFVKRSLIKGVTNRGDTLIDYACGKAGDLPKWIDAQLSFVFGVDIHKDNLENRSNGACARVLNMRKKNKYVPDALFVNGNSSNNIVDGSALLNDKAKQITKSVFGKIPKDPKVLDKAVVRLYGKGADGFNVSSCQFALHYFLESPDTLKGFMKNLAECTKMDGYFIGTAYDGKKIFDLLRDKEKGESMQIVQDDVKVWEVTKQYANGTFNEDNSSSIGYRIDVYQDSINKIFSEYLVNFDYLNKVMSLYGFELIDRMTAGKFGLPNASGLFDELFRSMQSELKKSKSRGNEYGTAASMSEYEKKISFLNRYFVYKKVRKVVPDQIVLGTEDFDQTQIDREPATEEELEKAEKADTKSKAKAKNADAKPKIRPLTKKMKLVGEVEQNPKSTFEKVEQNPKSTFEKVEQNPKPKLVIEDDSDDDDP